MGTCGGSLGGVRGAHGSLGDIGRVGGSLRRLSQSCGWQARLAGIMLCYSPCPCGLSPGRGLWEGCCVGIQLGGVAKGKSVHLQTCRGATGALKMKNQIA